MKRIFFIKYKWNYHRLKKEQNVSFCNRGKKIQMHARFVLNPKAAIRLYRWKIQTVIVLCMGEICRFSNKLERIYRFSLLNGITVNIQKICTFKSFQKCVLSSRQQAPFKLVKHYIARKGLWDLRIWDWSYVQNFWLGTVISIVHSTYYSKKY